MWVRAKEDISTKPTAYKIISVYVYERYLLGHVVDMDTTKSVTLGEYTTDEQAIRAFEKIMRAILNKGNYVDLNIGN